MVFAKAVLILECNATIEAEEALFDGTTSEEDTKKQHCWERNNQQKQRKCSLHNNDIVLNNDCDLVQH